MTALSSCSGHERSWDQCPSTQDDRIHKGPRAKPSMSPERKAEYVLFSEKISGTKQTHIKGKIRKQRQPVM